MTVFGIVLFVLALNLSVALHEWGHLVTAKHYGMKATQYFIGFGPRLWSFHRGETEYGIKAIPAGGYVKIVGMTTLEETDEADDARLFYRQPARRRAVVLSAGSIMHFLIAVTLLFGTFLILGTPSIQAPVVGAVATGCIPRTNPAAACAPGDPASPAQAVGFRVGDRILSVGGVRVTSWNAFTQLIRGHGPGPVVITIQRGGQRLLLRPDLVSVERNPKTGGPGTTPVGAVGLGVATTVTHPGFVTAVHQTVDGLGQMFTGTYDALVHKLGTLGTLFSHNRDPNGFVGVVGIARVSGQTFAASGEPFSVKLGSFLVLIADLNLFVGVFNLLPLLPLDGGHLAILGFEKLRGGVAHLFRRPDPGQVDITKLLPVAYAVIAVVVAVSVLILSADIVNPIRLPN
ncbi:MAG: M50 family metallopeptidase [Mycobacteriales bacterium]